MTKYELETICVVSVKTKMINLPKEQTLHCPHYKVSEISIMCKGYFKHWSIIFQWVK